jgi:tetratricopeptide (TPR) repeat protein
MDAMQTIIDLPGGDLNSLYLGLLLNLAKDYAFIFLKYIFIIFYSNFTGLIEALGGLTFNLIKIITSVLVLTFISMFFYRMLKDTGLAILPFETSNMGEKEYSGKSISDLLTTEMNRIKRIQTFDFQTFFISQERFFLPSLIPITETLDYSLAEMGDVGIGESKISLGRLFMTLKMLFGKSGKVIAGSLAKYDRKISLIAYLGGSEKRYWEVNCIMGKFEVPGQKIPELVHDLAFNIALDFQIIDDDSAKTWKDSAKTWKGLKHFTEALDAYILYTQTGKIDFLNDVVSRCNEALIHEPRYRKPFDVLGRVGFEYIKNKKYEDAKSIFNRISEYDLKSSELGLGIIYLELQLYLDSIIYFEKVIQSDPSNVEAWFGRLEVLIKKGDLKGSLEAVIKMMDLEKPSYAIWYSTKIAERILSFIPLLCKDQSEDEKLRNLLCLIFSYKAIKFDSGCSDAYYQKGFFLEALKNDVDSICSLIQKGEVVPGREELLALIKEDPLISFKKAIEINPKYSEAWLKKGRILADQNRHQEALKSYDKVIELNQYYKITLNLKNEDLSATLKSYDKAKILCQKAYYRRGISLATLNNQEAAIEAFDNAIIIDPDYVEAHMEKIASLEKLDRINEANGAKELAASAWFVEGLSYANKRNYDKAIEDFDKAHELNPNRGDVLYFKGFYLAANSKHAEAIRSYDMALETSLLSEGFRYRAMIEKGNSLAAQNEHGEALKSYNHAIELYPKPKEAYYLKGVSLAALNNYKDAIDAFDKVIDKDPQNIDAHKGKIASLEALNKTDEVNRAKKSAASVYIRNGVSLAGENNPEEAVKCFDKAIELDQNSAEAWHQKGLALAAQNKHNEAVKSYEKAIEKNPGSSMSYSKMADSLSALGRIDEAIKALKKAIEILRNEIDPKNQASLVQ